jgi:hypothetical protein
LEDTENYVVRKKPRISTSKPILSPTSPVSSPENLVIDCQTLSPRTLQNKTNSPNIDMSSEKLVSNAVVKAKITSPFHKVKQSPLHSPVHLNNPGSVSVSFEKSTVANICFTVSASHRQIKLHL